jgi:hypothetical protein
MPVQRSAIELGKNINLRDSAIYAIAHWYINKSILSSKGHSRLSPHLGEREQPGAGSASKNDAQNSFHLAPAAAPLWSKHPQFGKELA